MTEQKIEIPASVQKPPQLATQVQTSVMGYFPKFEFFRWWHHLMLALMKKAPNKPCRKKYILLRIVTQTWFSCQIWIETSGCSTQATENWIPTATNPQLSWGRSVKPCWTVQVFTFGAKLNTHPEHTKKHKRYELDEVPGIVVFHKEHD